MKSNDLWYKINKNLENSYEECKDSRILNYITNLRENRFLLKLNNVNIDLSNIAYRKFECDPKRCLTIFKDKRKIYYENACCTFFDVHVSKKEIENIKQLNKEIKKIVPEKPANNSFMLNDSNEWIIKHKDDNLCVFCYLDKAGILRCAIETICIEKKLPVSRYKPHACVIWPLSIHKMEKEYFLTAICPENFKVLCSYKISTYKCLTRPLFNNLPIYVSLEKAITFMFGKRFYKDLTNKINSLNESAEL